MRTFTSVLSAAFLLLWMLIPPGLGADSNAPQFSFGKAYEIGIDAQGRIYVTDSVTHIIDTRGRIYVANAVNDREVRLDDMSGTNWTSFGRFGSGVGNLSGPCGIAVDDEGKI